MFLLRRGRFSMGAEGKWRHTTSACLFRWRSGGWKAVFPDFPYFEIQEPNLDLAVFHAANALAQIKLANGTPIPAPRDLAAIKADLGWPKQQRRSTGTPAL